MAEVATVGGMVRQYEVVVYPEKLRDSVQELRELPLVTPSGAQVPLGQVAAIEIVDGPPMLKSENARLNGWTFVGIRGRDLGSFVREAQARVREAVRLRPGCAISWSGQYESLLRAQERLAQVLPLTLVILFVLLYLIFRRAGEVWLLMLSLPFALVGGVMLVYLDNALKDRRAAPRRRRSQGGDYGRRGHAHAPQGDDGRHHHRRPAPDHARHRHRHRGHNGITH